MKKIISLFLVIICLFIITGCEEKENIVEVTKEKDESTLKCSRTAVGMDNASASLNYTIYYKGDYVTKTVSIEKVISDDSNVLDTYQESYEKIFVPYKNIDYYDNKVDRTSDSVTCITVINYEKVDVSKILAIEGEEGNIYDEDGKVKKDTLVSFYKKYEAKCE